LVVAAVGETQEEADAFRSSVWNYIQPQDPVTALLVEDFVNTAWRLSVHVGAKRRKFEGEQIQLSIVAL